MRTDPITPLDTVLPFEPQTVAHDFTDQVLVYLVTGVFFALIVLLAFSTAIMPKATLDPGVRDVLFTLLGVVATGWANIIGFSFGSSVGSAQKSQTISSALLRGNPMARFDQATLGALKTAIQSDAPRLAALLDSPKAELAVALMGKALLGNAEAPLGDVAHAAQHGDRVKIATAEKEVQPALRQDHEGSLGDVGDSSPGSNAARPTVQGMEIGSPPQTVAHVFTNQVLVYLVTGVFFALIVLLMFSTAIMPKATLDPGVKDLLFTLLGVVAASWANIIGFSLGSSVGSAQKSQTISSALLRGNPKVNDQKERTGDERRGFNVVDYDLGVPSLFQERRIDANLLAERFAPGEIATLTITIRLPFSPTYGKWQGMVNLDCGPVAVILEVQGFKLLSELPAPFEVPQDRDSAPVAFELRIEEARQRWIHVILTQQGRPVGELSISDFSAMDPAPAKQTANSNFHRIAEADLTLVVRASDGRIEACSPRECASLDYVKMIGFKYPETSFRELLAARLRALYDEHSNPEETARELRIVGVELAACLPADLIKLLRRPDIHSVMLRHEDDFDFPLELCYLDDRADPFFVGDRIAICRWYLGVTNPPDVIFKHVRKVAFLKGNDDAFKADEALLNRLYPNRTVTFERRLEIVDKLFKTSEYDLIHFTGHCTQENMGILKLADGSSLRLIEIGQLESERAFADAQPFVMLNACASAQPYLGLVQRGSFAHRFVTSRACAFVGTLWPVAGLVANEFAAHFYAELADKPVGRALLAAKRSLMLENIDNERNDQDDNIKKMRRLARQVAARSYCLFANPDLRLS